MQFGKEGILKRLEQLDGDLLAAYGSSRHFELVIVGGSAFILRDLAPNKTFTVDIDVLRVESEIEGFLARYNMNTDVATFLYKFPEHFADRLVEISFVGMVLSVFTLSNEDLAITKLLSWRKQDRLDLKGMAQEGNIDTECLLSITEDPCELQINLDAEDWESFKSRLEQLLEWCR